MSTDFANPFDASKDMSESIQRGLFVGGSTLALAKGIGVNFDMDVPLFGRLPSEILIPTAGFASSVVSDLVHWYLLDTWASERDANKLGMVSDAAIGAVSLPAVLAVQNPAAVQAEAYPLGELAMVGAGGHLLGSYLHSMFKTWN